MATVLSCGVCHHPLTFRDIAPEVMGEVEKEISCPWCGTCYCVTVRMTQGPELPKVKVEEIKNRPSA